MRPEGWTGERNFGVCFNFALQLKIHGGCLVLQFFESSVQGRACLESSRSTKQDDDLEVGFSELDTPDDDGKEIDNIVAFDADQSDDNGDKENVEEHEVEFELLNETMNAQVYLSAPLDKWLRECAKQK
ncbi:uncharacterized protein HKW66_Vig0027810 [Vigna angularis]|uniref:Uncharacterized protein n=1 Tax=Phaseolus angularis TaxID=3914 RepID=A0A8T0L7N6_PHAAN|nr:uncharacterized protein HKW66_Vig0027810 [Vigna angularis]